ESGWAIGDGTDTDQGRELDALYGTLEREVLPAWADRARWLAMMEASIATVEERFSAERMVREYFARLYALWRGAKTASDDAHRHATRGQRRTHVTGEQARRRLVTAQMRVQVREREATEREV